MLAEAGRACRNPARSVSSNGCSKHLSAKCHSDGTSSAGMGRMVLVPCSRT